jgi:hypothetical protein
MSYCFSLFLGFSIKDNLNNVLLLLLPLLVIFFFFDMAYYRQEKLYRKLYDDIRKEKTTDFSMNVDAFKKDIGFFAGLKYFSILPYYMVLLMIIVIVFIYNYVMAGNGT